jgi:hypothetical protein
MRDSYTDHRRRHQTRDRDLRAGDRDRDAVADVLREQHLAGRLKADEFEERLDRCYAATTYGELDDLVADLPQRQLPSRPVGHSRRWLALALVPLLIAAIALSHGHLLWLAIPLLFFIGRPLVWHSVQRGRGGGFMGCAGELTRPRSSHV